MILRYFAEKYWSIFLTNDPKDKVERKNSVRLYELAIRIVHELAVKIVF